MPPALWTSSVWIPLLAHPVIANWPESHHSILGQAVNKNALCPGFLLPLLPEPWFYKYWPALPPGWKAGKVPGPGVPTCAMHLAQRRTEAAQMSRFLCRRKERKKVVNSLTLCWVTLKTQSVSVQYLEGLAHSVFSVCFEPCVWFLCVSVMSRGCKYVPDFILQTHIPINEHTHRCPHCESGPCVGARGSACHQAHFQKRLAAHYNIGFPLSCHYQTLSLKADPKDRQSIRRQSSHLYLLNVLMSSILRPGGFAAGYWSRGGDRWREVQDQEELGRGGGGVGGVLVRR